jgi:hypothetical protein
VRDYDRAAEIGGALQARLAEIRFPLEPPIEREIQRHVCAFADELKDLGLPPERIILAVKRAANEAGIYSTMRLSGFTYDLDGGDKLLADMVGWCIRRYYGEPRD